MLVYDRLLEALFKVSRKIEELDNPLQEYNSLKKQYSELLNLRVTIEQSLSLAENPAKSKMDLEAIDMQIYKTASIIDALKGKYVDKQERSNEERLLALNELYNYAKSLVYIDNDRTKEIVAAYLKMSGEKSNRYEQLIKDFNCDRRTIQYHLSYASNIASCILGCNENEEKDSINLILEGKIEDGMKQFRTNFFKLMPRGVMELLPDAKEVNNIKLDDCYELIQFFKFIAVPRFNKLVNENRDKIAHLRFILESEDEEYSKERDGLLEFLKEENQKLTNR